MAVQMKASSLVDKLQSAIKGEVRTSQIERLLYSTDASSYQVIPLCVVTPRDEQDVIRVVHIAAETGTSIVPRGGGTSLSGQTIGEGIVLDFSRYMNSVIEINAQAKWVRVQSGKVLADLNVFLQPHGLQVGPDPASAVTATIGGMTGNNSTGAHSILYGMMADHVKEVDVVLADGSLVRFGPKTPEQVEQILSQDTLESRIYRDIPALIQQYDSDIREKYPKTWRNVAGYNLNRILSIISSGSSLNLAPLIVGSEGTLGVITSIKLGVVERPNATYLAIIHFDDLRATLEAVPLILEHKPAAVELVDRYFNDLTRHSLEYASQLDFIDGDPRAVLIVEFYGDEAEALKERANHLEADLRTAGYAGIIIHRSTPASIAQVWNVRKAGLGLLMSKRGDEKPLAFVDDATVPIEHLAAYALEVESAFTGMGVEAAFFAHASAGCLHINPVVNPKTVDGLATMRKISETVMDIAIRYGGTTTGEHGEGFARSIYNEKLYGERLHQAFRQVKGIFDPDNIMNPGKIIDAPEPWDPNVMRLSPNYRTPFAPNTTFFDFSADGGFTGMVEMCNGQGVCRKVNAGVMCPSYMATRDEAHSTRGRANALRAAMSGQLGADGLYSDALYDVLDLCLECKACKRECPSMVDMAKLKYEFLAQYQTEKGVPLRSLLFANISLINRLSALPFLRPLANWGFEQPLLRYLLDKFVGIDQRRSLPQIAAQTFREWFYARNARPGEKGTVVLWDDTFLNYNDPEIGVAAVQLLEAMGYTVQMLEDRRCCGRPMISKGLLPDAIRHAEHNVKRLYPYVQAGIPVIGIEPSCIATLRDEYPDLLRSEDARLVAAGSYFIEEFVAQKAKAGELDNLPFVVKEKQTLYVHGHCHQRALIGTVDMMQMLGLIPNTDVQLIDSGCCGMAGSFGYEKEHYDISMASGEDRLFPTIRLTSADTLIAAPGTSCRHQIADATGRRAQHPIIFLAKALDIHEKNT